LSSIDNPVSSRIGRVAVGAGLERRIAIACFGIASAIGLVGAFVALDGHSFWLDELFTARLLEPAVGTDLLSRIATDVHPPLYMLALWLHAQVFGTGDAALRGLSAAAACGAIVVFLITTRPFFSLPARLFSAAIATNTLFWFFQAQNARSYALCLLFSAAIMALSLALLTGDDGRNRWRKLLPALLTLMAIGSFVHFYVMYECLAVLFVLAAFNRRRQVVLAAAAVVLLLASAAYVKFVIAAHSQVTLDNNWYLNTPTWYLTVLQACVRYSFGSAGLVALALCAVGALAGCAAAAPSPGIVRLKAVDPVITLLVGVPVLVLVGGIVSSTLLAPNFFDRNFLVVSPFIWGLSAWLYDAAMKNLGQLLRVVLASALAVIVLPMTAIVGARLPANEAPAFYEPFRSSAAWIRMLPACEHEILPVLSPENPAWYKPGYAAIVYDSAYGRYLHGFAQPRHFFTQDIEAGRLPADVKAELTRRLNGSGCPVLAWDAHNIDAKEMERVKANLLRSLGYSGSEVKVGMRAFTDGADGYVLYVRP